MALGDDVRLDPSISHGCFQASSRPICSGLGRDLADETEPRTHGFLFNPSDNIAPGIERWFGGEVELV